MEQLLHALHQHYSQSAQFTASPPQFSPEERSAPAPSPLAPSPLVPAADLLALLSALAARAPGCASASVPQPSATAHELFDAADAQLQAGAAAGDQWAAPASDCQPLPLPMQLSRLAQLCGGAEWQRALFAHMAPLLAACWRQNLQLQLPETAADEKDSAAASSAVGSAACEPSPHASSTSSTSSPFALKKRAAVRVELGVSAAAVHKPHEKRARVSLSDSLGCGSGSPPSDRDAREDASASASAAAGTAAAEAKGGERVPRVELSARVVGELAKIENRLGAYVCRLCGVRFEHAVALANHSCPRLVAAEHRCADCGKLFSCPANLASHRRWHVRRATLSIAAAATAAASASAGSLLTDYHRVNALFTTLHNRSARPAGEERTKEEQQSRTRSPLASAHHVASHAVATKPEKRAFCSAFDVESLLRCT